MDFSLTLLEAGVHRPLPIPDWGYGLIAFLVLALMLYITYAIGKGRPHS